MSQVQSHDAPTLDPAGAIFTRPERVFWPTADVIAYGDRLVAGLATVTAGNEVRALVWALALVQSDDDLSYAHVLGGLSVRDALRVYLVDRLHGLRREPS